MMRIVAGTCMMACVACAESEPGPLVLNDGWTLQMAGDLYPEHAPDLAGCGPEELGGFYVEGPALEIATARCAYFALETPALLSLRRGDSVDITWYHSTLVAKVPGEAHIAIAVGDDILWEDHVAIPANGNVLDVSAPVSENADSGAPVRIHLHNHGTNTWTFLNFTVVPR